MPSFSFSWPESKPSPSAFSWQCRTTHFLSPEIYNEFFTMHGTTMVFLVGMPILFGFAQLPGAADGRRARHGVPAPECIQLLDDGVRRAASLFQLYRRLWSLRHGQRARRRLVGLCAAHRQGVHPRAQYRLLGAGAHRQRIRHAGHGHQYHRNHRLHALPRHDAVPHAAVRVAHACGQRAHPHHHHSAHGRAGDAADRPLSRRPFLRHAGRRFRGGVDALLLDLRPS